MMKYGKIINEENGLCEVGTGDNSKIYRNIGYRLLDVKQSDIDNQWYLAEKCPMKSDEQKAAEEAERIAMLNLTSADVERAIYQAKGMDFDDIIAFIEAQPLSEDELSPKIDIKALKIELKANNFYRGNPYVETIGKLLGFTDTQLNEFFETNDYTKLLPEEET